MEEVDGRCSNSAGIGFKLCVIDMEKDVFKIFKKYMNELFESEKKSDQKCDNYLIRGESEIGDVFALESLVGECTFRTKFHVTQYWKYFAAFDDAKYMLLSIDDKPETFEFGNKCFEMFSRS